MNPEPLKPEGMSDYKFRKIKKYIKTYDEWVKRGDWDGTAKHMVYPTKYGLAIGEIEQVRELLKIPKPYWNEIKQGNLECNITDDFSCVGLVHPTEYNWKEQFQAVKVQWEKDCIPFVELDVGKVLGLCKYIIELEKVANKK